VVFPCKETNLKPFRSGACIPGSFTAPAVWIRNKRILVALLRYNPPEEWTARKTAKQTARGRKQDRAEVAGGQKYEVGYESKKTGKSAAAVKKAVKKVGNTRKKVEKRMPGKRS
jgi:hypothetical protein